MSACEHRWDYAKLKCRQCGVLGKYENGSLVEYQPPCIACEGSGRPSRGSGDCIPCAGTGRRITWVSPSQVFDQRLCRRKRWYKQVAKLYRPPHPSAQLGADVHSVIERYLTGAGEIDSSTKAGAIAIKGIYLLPEPPQHFVELAPMFLRNGAFGYRGKIDLLQAEPLTIIDHKTSSNPKRYGLTVETLPCDPQAIVYSWFGFQLVPEATSLNLQWNYFPTRSGRPYPVRVQMQRDYVEHAMRHGAVTKDKRTLPGIDETAKEIIADNQITDSKSVPGDISACGAYGGCGYADICSVAKQSTLALALSEGANIRGNETMAINSDILERIRAANAAAPAPAPAPAPALAAAPTPAPAPAAAAQSPALATVLAQLRASQGAALAPAPAPVAAPAPAPLPPLAPAAAPAPAPAPIAAPATNGGGYTLYVNCIPLGDEYLSADVLIAEANSIVCVEHNVTHYKAIDYGKGTGYLAEALAKMVPHVDGPVVILPGRENNDALHCLRFFAAKVIQGI